MRLFRVFIPTSIVALLLAETILLFCCFVLAGYFQWGGWPDVFLFYENGAVRVSVVVGSLLLGLYFIDLYTNILVPSRMVLYQQVCLLVGAAFLVQALLGYLTPDVPLPRDLMIAGSGLVLLVIPVWRIFYGSLVIKAMGGQKVLFLGSGQLVQEIASRMLERPELGMAPIGYVGEEACWAGSHCPYLGPISEFSQTVTQLKPARIVVGMPERRGNLPLDELLDLRLSGMLVEEAASWYETAFGRVSTAALHPSQLIFARQLGPSQATVALQSLASLLMALSGTIVMAPAMVIVAVMIKLTSAGPVFYRQTRVGLNNKPFVLYKFRSMYVDAEAATGAVWAQQNDPRVTPVGKWLRLTRLDELPQFFNVLRGEMVIVGPRPERPEFVKMLSEKIGYYRQRHAVKPGITGWAQINYKYGNTLDDTITKLEYDLYYIKNVSLSLDFYIIFHTLKTMLLSRGAH